MSSEESRPVRVVLYVDDSRHWHPVAAHLARFVRAQGGHVTITASLILPGARARALQKAQEILALPSQQVDALGRAGIIEYTLPEVARQVEADLVVVGRLGSADRLTSGLIGSLVAKRTPSSVLLARGKVGPVARVLACTEGSPNSMRVFECASRVARVFGARLDVLHVASQMGLTDRAREEIDADLADFLHSDVPEAAHLRELDARLRGIGLEGKVFVRAGLVVEEITDAVREGNHDLLVIGAHDVDAPGANLYEDFSSLILRASPVSTLVVRKDGAGEASRDP